MAGIFWRYFCHSIMLIPALWNEARPAARVPDLLVDSIPHFPLIWRYNYYIWIAGQIPAAIWLWRRDRALFLRFLYAGGVISLVRGLCIPLTGLGPINGEDINTGLSARELLHGWLAVVNPISALFGQAAHIYLTKDMFFSGHVATTWLLWLYCRHIPRLGFFALICHIVVVISVFLSHLHYSIDVVGAWLAAYVVYRLCNRWFDAHSLFTRSRGLAPLHS